MSSDMGKLATSSYTDPFGGLSVTISGECGVHRGSRETCDQYLSESRALPLAKICFPLRGEVEFSKFVELQNRIDKLESVMKTPVRESEMSIRPHYPQGLLSSGSGENLAKDTLVQPDSHHATATATSRVKNQTRFEESNEVANNAKICFTNNGDGSCTSFSTPKHLRKSTSIDNPVTQGEAIVVSTKNNGEPVLHSDAYMTVDEGMQVQARLQRCEAALQEERTKVAELVQILKDQITFQELSARKEPELEDEAVISQEPKSAQSVEPPQGVSRFVGARHSDQDTGHTCPSTEEAERKSSPGSRVTKVRFCGEDELVPPRSDVSLPSRAVSILHGAFHSTAANMRVGHRRDSGSPGKTPGGTLRGLGFSSRSSPSKSSDSRHDNRKALSPSIKLPRAALSFPNRNGRSQAGGPNGKSWNICPDEDDEVEQGSAQEGVEGALPLEHSARESDEPTTGGATD